MPKPAIRSLGYFGLQVSDLSAWTACATEILGLMADDDGVPDRRRFRIDQQAWRISVSQGPQDDIVFVGFEVAGPIELEAMRVRLAEAGVAFAEAEPALLAERNVLELIHCQDPIGLAIEIYYGPHECFERPFVSPAGTTGFVTGGQGAGHIVLSAPDMAACETFYAGALGLRLSDVISMPIGPGMTIDLRFYHCNPRHHTLALVPAPAPRRLHHFMLQTRTLDDVGLALDRAIAGGMHVAQTLGRHTNDHMVSFYAVVPGGFQVEYGWGARDVAEHDWRVVRHQAISIWGHKFQPAP
jgi:2,3-dihydroxybiphenyl 1,2-dioxygenase